MFAKCRANSSQHLRILATQKEIVHILKKPPSTTLAKNALMLKHYPRTGFPSPAQLCKGRSRRCRSVGHVGHDEPVRLATVPVSARSRLVASAALLGRSARGYRNYNRIPSTSRSLRESHDHSFLLGLCVRKIPVYREPSEQGQSDLTYTDGMGCVD